MSFYSFGRLSNGEKIGNHLYFPQGSSWTVSFHDDDQAWQLAKGIIKDASLAYGMRVQQALEITMPRFERRVRFAVDGEVIVRSPRPEGGRDYLLWTDERADKALTQLLRRKLQVAGYSENHQAATIKFDRQYAKARTKLMEIKGTKHKGSVCPVIIEATPEVMEFAWLVGVGELTGSGFGALK
jgi:CRISPR-associated endoribonuclease Cas6